jgi:cellulose synthase/poly-beta-1,6-N-acetylglucosamine synthase-like glycosyltransferase
VYLKDTLISLLQQEFPSEQYEIIVVDNRPTGEVRHIVQKLEREWQGFIRSVEEPHVGLHNARHAGAKVARGEILVYVDDDIIAPSGWLSAILEPFKDPLVALAGGKIKPKWEAQPPEWLSQFPPSYLSLLDLGEERQELRWPKGVYGCNMAVRRSTLYEVGGFNPDAMGERRFIWFRGDGETGLHRKVSDAGYKAIYEPRAWVYHRITPERLKARAFYDRGLLVGLSWSYSHIRNTKEHSYFTLRIIRHALLAFLRTIRCCMRAVFQRNRRVRCISDAWLWYGYGMQHLYAAIIPRLRAFLLKDSYLG